MIRRGIVVTHGVGSQRRIDQLDVVVEPLMTFLGRALGYKNVHLVARTQVSDDLLASAVIQLTPPNGAPEEWHVREAWWAESFRSSPSATVLPWAVGAAVFHVRSTWHNVFVRNLGRVIGRGPAPPQAGIWGVVGAGKGRAFFDALIWLVLTLGYLAVYLLGALLIIPLYVFLLLPFAVLWPAGIGELQRSLVNMLTGGIGDQHATTNRQVAVAGAADTIARALWYFLAPNRPNERLYDTVTLIAHSGGCVVSYAALARQDVQGWLRESRSLRRVTWITVGSGLNLAWRMRAKTKARDKAFWSHRLRETVNWIDIYARYDPVPQGPAPKGLVTSIMGKAPRPYVSIRVANHDWPLTDHGAYWDNREEAMSRIVHAVTDSRLGQRPLNELGGSYAQLSAEDGTAQPHPLAAAVERATMEAGARRTRVTMQRLGSFLLVAVGALLVFGWGPSLGAWVLAEPQSLVRLPWPPVAWRQTLGDLVPSQIGPLAFGAWRSWIAGVLVLAILIYSVAIIGRLVAHWWAWRQREPSDLVVSTAQPVRRRPPVQPGGADGTSRQGLA
jgi:hypothetical protein